MKTCLYCDLEFFSEEVDAEVCSAGCKQTHASFEALSKSMMGTQTSNDSRIFFYPMSFGRLIDEYTTLSLKRANTRSIRYQQEMDYALFKCRKSIESHLAQLMFSKFHRESLGRLSQKLFQTASRIWNLNERARAVRNTDEGRRDAAYQIIPLNDERHKIIRELDILQAGKSGWVRIYGNREFS